MQLCSVFPKCPVNVLSYFHNLKNNKKVIALKKRQTKILNKKLQWKQNKKWIG